MRFKIGTLFGLLLSLSVVVQAQTLPPSDIENLTVEVASRSATLSWDGAEDDGFVTGYRVYYGTSSVLDENDTYEDDTYTNSTDTEFVLEGLINGVEYYFSVTAIDDDQLESINYSNEVSGTPVAEPTGDTEGPKVISATHTAANEITLVMSEPVAEVGVDAFLISNIDDFDEVIAESLRFNSENIIITVPVDSLVAAQSYEIIATSAVEDLFGNPVSSGITDTVVFEARGDFEAPTADDPQVTAKGQPEETSLTDIIDEDFDEFEELFSEIEETPAAAPVIEAPEPEPERASAPDTVAPFDAQNLQADTRNVESSNQVTLSLETALDFDNDIVDQVLYTRVGLGAWDQGYSLGAEATETNIDVQPNQNYQVRVVTVDLAGNQSQGVAFSFSTNLTQSGPGTVIALSIALLIGMMMLMSSRRRV